MGEIKLHKKYQPLFDPSIKCRYYVVTGGRGSAKSFSVSTAACNWTTSEEINKILLTRYTMTAAHISIIPEFSEKIELMGMQRCFDVQLKDIVNLETVNSILFRGIKTSSGNQTANLKSIQGITIWILDEAEELDDEDTFDKIDLSIRQKGIQNRVVLVLNPSHKKHWMYKRFFDEAKVEHDHNGVVGDVCYIHTTYLDNIENLSDSYIATANKMRESNFLKYQHLFMGAWLDEMAGALWTWNMINDHRVDMADVPERERIAVSIDPAVTNTKTSDETGIVSGCRGVDGHYYIFEDASIKASPLGWAKTSCRQFRKWDADRVIGEVNNGGDLVEITLRQVDREIPYKAVHASRGKIVRAEPVAALYEQGLVHHVGIFSDMETEMMTFTGSAKDVSPNRLDALVWLLAELSDGKNRPFIAGDDDNKKDVDKDDAVLQNADVDDESAWWF